MQKPTHVAVIMDGNGRWAKARGHSRFWGHLRGARAARDVIMASIRREIPYLTLFAFSTENWFRPEQEVSFLMKLLIRQLMREKQRLVDNNVVFHCIGDFSRLPKPVIAAIRETIQATSQNDGMNLTFALSYSGRQDLTNSMQQIAKLAEAGRLKASDIDDEMIAKTLSTSFAPDPDLIIRTSGESRISNFFLWQAAYSELHFCEKMWPDFTDDDLDEALENFANKERRFGHTSEQVQDPDDEKPWAE